MFGFYGGTSFGQLKKHSIEIAQIKIKGWDAKKHKHPEDDRKNMITHQRMICG